MLNKVDVKFVLLYSSKQKDNVKYCFEEIRKIYVCELMSPFYTPGTPFIGKEVNKHIIEILDKMIPSKKT